ncbi:MAG: UDP-4-amino-4,6-dideoxy-N-acetyl-beta-L-altrosami ne transaminase [Calditrichia bacterium]
MEIPFHRSYTTDADIQGVVDTLKSGWLTMGPRTVQFENRFAELVSANHAVAVNSCTAALHLSLRVLGIGPGDEVIVPAMTFAASAEVVCYLGARPVITDVDPETHLITVDEIEKHLSPKTKAIIPVHFAGQAVDLDEIMDLAKKHQLKVVEDAAHCFPSFYKGRPIGGIGDVTAFSFYATKTLAVGEGGMATTNDEELANQMKILRLHGISRDAWKRYTREGSWYYEVVDAGFKYNMTDIQASLGLTQLDVAEEAWKKRTKIAERYNTAFREHKALRIPVIKTDRQTSWHLYVLRINPEALTISRDDFINKLKEAGIGTSVHFIPLYRHPYYRQLTNADLKNFPNSEWLFERIISLPIFPGMTEEQIDYVIDNVLRIADEFSR